MNPVALELQQPQARHAGQAWNGRRSCCPGRPRRDRCPRGSAILEARSYCSATKELPPVRLHVPARDPQHLEPGQAAQVRNRPAQPVVMQQQRLEPGSGGSATLGMDSGQPVAPQVQLRQHGYRSPSSAGSVPDSPIRFQKIHPRHPASVVPLKLDALPLVVMGVPCEPVQYPRAAILQLVARRPSSASQSRHQAGVRSRPLIGAASSRSQRSRL